MLVVGSGRSARSELVRLVLDGHGDLLELVAVLAGVVGAEQELAAGLELDAEVGLRAAAIAPVIRGQGARGNGCLLYTSPSPRD